MALEGSLTDFGLADILQLIYFQRKTGVLVLEGRMDKVKLYFVEGNISGAESKRRLDDNRLGKVLAKKGLIRDEDLQSALDEQHKTGAKLGNVLIKKQLVAKEAVTDILSSQITETVIQIFSWKEGTYEFTSKGVAADRDFSFSLDTQHLLMEGLRIVDEWSVIKEKLTLDTLFRKTGKEAADLTEEEGEIFGLVDGENDVSTMIDLAGKDNFEVSKTILALMEKGLIETVEAAPVLEAAETAEKRGIPFLGVLTPAVIALSFVLSLGVFFISRGDSLKRFEAAEKLTDLRFRIEAYRVEHSSYPPSLDLISHAEDPWGRPYIYRSAADSYVLVSEGPDGREGTADDLR